MQKLALEIHGGAEDDQDEYSLNPPNFIDDIKPYLRLHELDTSAQRQDKIWPRFKWTLAIYYNKGIIVFCT